MAVSPKNQWNGASLTQDDLMYKDMVILVDENDKITGKGSKYDSHRFVPGQPRGLLHRAFSVFMFDSKNRLLLQQRAESKITFPKVWTNTCCSHPLFGFEPTEIDLPEEVEKGNVNGVKRAAIRKLNHELGIPISTFSPENFKFLTRVHYYAGDILTHGKNSPWGEHEIDYILLLKTEGEIKMDPCKDEVMDTKWVSADELKEMMDGGDGLLWSPWFKIIANEWLIPRWWKDLDKTLKTQESCDYKTIHRFDPPATFRGGAGVCGFITSEEKNSKGKLKQGAYGKIPVFKNSKMEQLLRLDEVFFMVMFKLGFNGGSSCMDVDKEPKSDRKFCDEMLGRVSRSFCLVIRQLPKELGMEVAVFYLFLRGLDTVEDDMSAFPDPEDKVHCLERFHETVLLGKVKLLGSEGGGKGRPSLDKFLTVDGLTGIGEGDEKALIENMIRVSRVYDTFDSGAQRVIKEITRDMGKGMAEFVSKDLGQGTKSVEEYNLYCHYVAGLVGEGLCRLFAVTRIERPALTRRMDLANSMGLFLQKNNIIRDYLEDYVEGRAFWPKEVWEKHAVKTKLLGELSLPENRRAACNCLNELVIDALQLMPDCIDYMSQIQNQQAFRFCGIPQVMAAATLAEVFDNPRVFEGVVKIRKGQTVKLMMNCTSMRGLVKAFHASALRIYKRLLKSEPGHEKKKEACERILQITAQKLIDTNISTVSAASHVALALLSVRVLAKNGSKGEFGFNEAVFGMMLYICVVRICDWMYSHVAISKHKKPKQQ